MRKVIFVTILSALITYLFIVIITVFNNNFTESMLVLILLWVLISHFDRITPDDIFKKKKYKYGVDYGIGGRIVKSHKDKDGNLIIDEAIIDQVSITPKTSSVKSNKLWENLRKGGYQPLHDKDFDKNNSPKGGSGVSNEPTT